MVESPRTLSQRIVDTRRRLTDDVDCWVATGGPSGAPYLLPLSFLWDGRTVLMATAATSLTARNALAQGRVRLGLGPTRDVVLIDGTVRGIPDDQIPDEVGDAFAAKAGFDPRPIGSAYVYLEVTPTRIQAWREVNELAAREVMRDGMWLSG